MNAKAKDEVMTIPQVALALGVRYTTARDLILKGEIEKGRYEGRNLIVPKSAVEGYLEKKKKRELA